MARKSISLTVRCLHVVTASPEPVSATEVARCLNKPTNEVRILLARLVHRSLIQTSIESHRRIYWLERPEVRIWDIFGAPRA